MKVSVVRLGIALALMAFVVVAADRATAKGLPEPGGYAPPSGSIYQAPHSSLLFDPEWSIYVFGGVSAGRSRLIELIPFPLTGDYGDDYLAAAAVSRRLHRFDRNWVVDGEMGAGYRFGQTNSPEVWAALFLRFEGFPWNHIVRTTVAVSTGLSYIGSVPETEKARATERGNPDGARLLHYFSPEITFARPDNPHTEFVIRYHHRSGVFGTFKNVWGGSNVLTGGLRQHF